MDDPTPSRSRLTKAIVEGLSVFTVGACIALGVFVVIMIGSLILGFPAGGLIALGLGGSVLVITLVAAIVSARWSWRDAATSTYLCPECGHEQHAVRGVCTECGASYRSIRLEAMGRPKGVRGDE